MNRCRETMSFLKQKSNVAEYEMIENELGKESSVPSDKLEGSVQRKFSEFGQMNCFRYPTR